MNSSSQQSANQPPSSQATSEYRGGSVKWHDASNPEADDWQRVAAVTPSVETSARPTAFDNQARGNIANIARQTKRLLLLVALSLALHAALLASLLPYAFGEHRLLMAAALCSVVGVIFAAFTTLTALRSSARRKSGAS